MSLFNGLIFKNLKAIVLLILLIPAPDADCQKGILDSIFTFRAGTVKTGNALDIISSQSGYNFTYDSRLINSEAKAEMTYTNIRLRDILKNVLNNDSLVYSVIDKYIIISRLEKPSTNYSDTLSGVEVSYVTGVIIDEETSEPLVFATIGLRNKGKGTVSNNNGEFGLKITSDFSNDTITFSYLGYISRDMPVKQILGSNLTIKMKREFISIPEIIIKNQIPQEIISRARLSIAQNYGTTPALMTGFYREGVLKKNELQSYSEAILKIFKSSYSGALLGDQIKVFKSRKIDNADVTDTLAIRLKAGLSTCLELDGVKNLFDFLRNESMQDYSYRMTDIVTYDDESAYSIEFEQHENIEIPLYKGTIYINTSDYSILNAEFELKQSLIRKMKGSFITNSSRGFNTWPVSAKYSVSYRKVSDRYFLSHVRGDLVFSSNQKKKLFSSVFKVFFELAITDIDLENARRFEREELAPVHSIFSKTITSYDPLFWGSLDFLRPEENLLQALKKMNVTLREFSE